MRVFQNIFFDLGDRVLFKDTLPYVEDVLKRNGFAYDGMAFMMSVSSDKQLFKQLLEKYPQLDKYIRIETGGWEITTAGLRAVYENGEEIRPFVFDISSVPQYWPEPYELHIDREDEPVIRELVTQIPRPFNPGGVCVVLDHVCWFPKINTEPAIKIGAREPSGFGAFSLYSNHVELVKDFKMGRKHNQVSINIERTHSFDELLDISPVLDKLTVEFGEPRCIAVPCIVFSDEEKQRNEAADKALKPVLEQLQNILNIDNCFPTDDPPAYITICQPDGADLMIPMKGEPISPKKAIFKAIKETGYNYTFFPGGFYECNKININNHRFQILFSQNPSSRYIEYGITVSGYNFDFCIPLNIHGVDVMKQSVVEEIARSTFAASMKAEEYLTDVLLQLYGKTPDWYYSNSLCRETT